MAHSPSKESFTLEEAEDTSTNFQERSEGKYNDNPIFTASTYDNNLPASSICKSSYGAVKKKCWILAAILVFCCVASAIGMGLTISSKSSDTNEITTTTYEPINKRKESISPSLTPSQSPSSHPTVFDCNDLCLADIEKAECPDNPSLLQSCETVEVGMLCFDGNNCSSTTAINDLISSHSNDICGNSTIHNDPTKTEIYRRNICPIDEPWKPATNGFEYYIETILMDWESHRQRALKFNASLASIHAQVEMNFLIQMLSDPNVNEALIGGIRKGIANDPWNNGTSMYWKWIDNTPWDFTSGWKTGHPNGKNTIDGSHGSVVVLSELGMRNDLLSINLRAIYKRPIGRTNDDDNHGMILMGLGFDHSCASNFNHKLYCWGMNEHSELGDETTKDKLIPAAIHLGKSGRTIVQLAAGWHHTCVILDDNSLNCWGRNDDGQLGDGTTITPSKPMKINSISGGNNITKVALGGHHTCAIFDDGSLKCWGRNHDGQLGDNTTIDKHTPIDIEVGVGKTVTQLSLGGSHTCVVLDDTTLKCWGKNNNGQLGDKTFMDKNGKFVDKHIPTYIDIDADGRYISQLALGRSHTCILLDDGSLKCWGWNFYGQAGDEATNEIPDPTLIDFGVNKTVSQISLGAYHTCAVIIDEGDDDSSLLNCWGMNMNGQLGDGTLDDTHHPTEIYVGAGKTITQLALGGYHTCVVLDGNAIRCWGKNIHGQLGNGMNETVQNASWEKFVILK